MRISPRRTAAALLLCAAAFQPAPALAQKGDANLLALVPGDAAAFVHVRFDVVRKSPWFKVLPEEIRREIQQIHLPFYRGEVDELVLVSSSVPGLFGGHQGRKFADVPEKLPPPKVDKIEEKPCGPKPDPDKKDVAAEENGSPLFILRLPEKFDRKKLRVTEEFNGPLSGKLLILDFGAVLLLPDQRNVIFAFDPRVLKNLAKRDGPLSTVVAQVRDNDYAVAMGLAMTDKGRQWLQRDLAEPFDLGHDAFMRRLLMPYTELKSAFLTLSAADRPAVKASAVFTSAATAKRGKLGVEDALAILRIMGLAELEREVHFMRGRALTEDRELGIAHLEVILDAAEESLREVKVSQEKETVHAEGTFTLSAGDVAKKAREIVKARADDPSIKSVRLRAINTDNLRNLGLAMHSFHDVHKQLPGPAICDLKTGKPLLSWRVALLPFLDEGKLFKEFKLDEPWDSDHNMKLLDRVPAVFAPPGLEGKEKVKTFFQVFVGRNAMFEMQPDARAPHGVRGLRLVAIPDGTSNTIMIVEAGKPVPWTKPEDLPFDDTGKTQVPGLGGISKEGFLACFGDGRVEFFRLPVAQRGLWQLIHRQDGEVPMLLDRGKFK